MSRVHRMTTPITLICAILGICVLSVFQPIQKTETHIGACTHYKVTYRNKQSKSTQVSKGTAKVIINRNRRKFEFYTNDKLVFVYIGFSNIMDDKLNEETINFDSDAQAIIDYKAKELVLYTEMMYSGRQCQQYEITGFKLQLE